MILLQPQLRSARAFTEPQPDPQLSISLSASSGLVDTPVTVTGGITNPAGGNTTGTFSANVAGSWSATTITLNGGTLSASRTFTPSALGTVTFTLTGNNGALSAPPRTYTSHDGSEWWQSETLNQWVELPNSALAYNLDNTYLTAAVGATVTGGAVYYGANEIGVTASAREGYGVGSDRFEYSGMATYAGKAYIGGGDAFWGDTAVHAYDLLTRSWTAAVIASTTALKFDNSDAFGDRHRDGSKKGTHNYWTQHVIGARNWYAQVTGQQFWPNDAGGLPTCCVGNLSTGFWDPAANPIPAMPYWRNDQNEWQQKHPVTEDIYATVSDINAGNSLLLKWTQTTNTWSVAAVIPSSNGSGSIDWVNNYIVFGGPTHQFMVDLGTGGVTTTTGVPDFGKSGGIHYNPDRNSHMIYVDTQVVTELTRSGSVFTQSGSLVSGTPPLYEGSYLRTGGGIKNKWQYMPEINGMVLRLAETLPMYYIRTS